MRSREDRTRVARLVRMGIGDQEIASRTGVSRRTVNRWRSAPRSEACSGRESGAPPWRPTAPRAYSYLLGLYLGDGYVAWPAGRTPFLQLSLDGEYPSIVGEAAAAVEATASGPPAIAYRRVSSRCVVVQCSWRRWPEAFPQHGPGRKHQRPMALTAWQREVTDAFPRELLRGLIHSDGCRCVNRFTIVLPSGRTAEYEYPRYFFSNLSADIRGLFCEYCDRLGIRWSRSNPRNISVASRASVDLLDSFVGPKR